MGTTRSPLRRLLALFTVLLLAATTVACDRVGGTSVEDDPEGALREALEALADYDGVELLLQLSADETARAQALAEGDMDEDELELLLTSSVLVRASGDGDEDGAAEFVVTVDGTAVAELRVLPDLDLYLRLDLDAILELVDDPEARQTIDELAIQADAFGLREVVEAAQRGEWIHVTGLEQLMNLFGGPQAQPQDDVDEEEAERLAEEFSAAAIRFLDEDVSVTYVGSDDTGERVRATTDGAALRSFLEELSTIAASSDAFGGADPQDLAGELDELPADATITFDAWISGGELTQIALDLAALDDAGEIEGELLLVVGIAEFTGSIDAPDEAARVDLFGLLGGFMGGLGGAGGDLFGGDPIEEEVFDEADAADNGGFEDDGFDEGEFGADCLTEEDLDEMRAFLDEEQQEELDQAIEAGLIPVC
jgi:hypothetical protein